MDVISDLLSQQGFFPVASPVKAVPVFGGTLKIEGLDVNIEIRFNHRELDYPDVFLTDWPFNKELRKALGPAHVSSDGKICHTDNSRAWWDVGNRSRFTAGVIEAVKSLLTQKIKGQISDKTITADFGGYWDAGINLYVAEHLQPTGIYVVKNRNGSRWITSENNCLSWLTGLTAEPATWVSINLKQPLVPQADHWPPERLKHITHCIEASDDDGLLKISKALHESIFKKTKENKKRNSGKIGVILNWPGSNGTIGLGAAFSFLPDSSIKSACEQGRLKGISAFLKSSLLEVMRYNLLRADAKYLHTRNEASQDLYLHNKKILIVGAGSIGGYLSHILCGMGGGAGNKGKVQLIDFDVFKPENVGRHFLGIESLGRPKTEAVGERLMTAYPHLNIEPILGSILNNPKLLEAPDVIINATGSQTVSIGIEYLLTRIRNKNIPPVIHSWIQGQGLASVTLINEHSKKACFRCLWKLDTHDNYTFRYPIAKDSKDEELIFAGCHQSYHPYAATAAITAASDAANALKELAFGDYKNTLRFNFIQPDKCQNRPDANPLKSDDCPICSARNDYV